MSNTFMSEWGATFFLWWAQLLRRHLGGESSILRDGTKRQSRFHSAQS